MAIVEMSKFHLMSFGYDREKLLEDLQHFDYVHFEDLQKEDQGDHEGLDELELPEEIAEYNEELAKVRWAIETLQPYKRDIGMITEMKLGKKNLTLDQIQKRAQDFDFDENYERIRALGDQREALHQDKQNLETEYHEYKPWEKLSIPISELSRFETVKAFTGTVPEKYIEEVHKDLIEFEKSYMEVVDSLDGVSYLLFITTNEEYNDLLEVLRRHAFTEVNLKTSTTVKEKLSEIEQDQKEIDEELKILEDRLDAQSYLLENFEIYHDYLDNEKEKITSSENFLTTSSVDIMEGYIPTKKEEEFRSVLDKVLGDSYYLEMSKADRDDANVPIILQNGPFAEAYENTTAMYSLPRYNEIDPTPLLAPFYAFFAGMMVGDLGYGLVLFIGTFIALKAFNLNASQRKFFKFMNFMAFFAIIWGVIYGSFFGGIIDMPVFIDQQEDSMLLIILSLAFGGVHLFFAMGIQAYMNIRDGKPLDALFDVGFWYMLVIGLIVMVVAMVLELSPAVGEISKWVAIIGAVGILITGGRDASGVAGKAVGGLYSLYGVTSYIGDFVSYLRLMALGLSGGFIAVAVNLIVGMLFDGGIAGIIAGVIIFAVMQAFNIFLSYLSAYVHAARLTYVEMFNKYYEGGGKPFKKMIKESKFFNIINQNE